MYQAAQHATLRSEVCEYSLRRRPNKVVRFQAGCEEKQKSKPKKRDEDNSYVEEKPATTSIRNLFHNLRSYQEDSIESDFGICNFCWRCN